MAKIIRKPNPTKTTPTPVAQPKQNPQTAKTKPLKTVDPSPVSNFTTGPRFLPERNHKGGCLFVLVLFFMALVVTAFFLF